MKIRELDPATLDLLWGRAFDEMASWAQKHPDRGGRLQNMWQDAAMRSKNFRSYAEVATKIIEEETKDPIDEAFLRGVGLGTMVGYRIRENQENPEMDGTETSYAIRYVEEDADPTYVYESGRLLEWDDLAQCKIAVDEFVEAIKNGQGGGIFATVVENHATLPEITKVLVVEIVPTKITVAIDNIEEERQGEE